MKPIHGKILMLTGVVHSIGVGLPIHWVKWQEFANKLFWNVNPHELNFGRPLHENLLDIRAEAAVWFFIGGVVFFVLGQIVHELETRLGRLPAYLGWELLGVALLFSWMIPLSGFPIILAPQALYMILRQRRGTNERVPI